MNKFLLKLALVSITISVMASTYAPTTFAQDDGVPAATDDGGATAAPKSQIPGDACFDPEELAIHVVLEEGFSSNIGTPESSGEKVISCFRVTQCGLKNVNNNLNVISQDPKKQTVEKIVCESELKTECPKTSISSPSAKAEKEKTYTTCQKVQVLVTKKGGAGLIYLYVGTIYRWAASLVGILCVLMLVINGIIISASAGDQQAVTNAKTRITQSLVALVILFLSAIILNTANPNFFNTDEIPTPPTPTTTTT